MIYGDVPEIIENKCVKEGHPLSTAIIFPILCDNWKKVRDNYQLLLIYCVLQSKQQLIYKAKEN